MIDRPLHQITYADIERFVAERWPEGKTLDYKRDAYGNKDDDKKELLKDVSSFANTQGGDILIGVDEDKGLPTGIPGVTLPDIDKEKSAAGGDHPSGTGPPDRLRPASRHYPGVHDGHRDPGAGEPAAPTPGRLPGVVALHQ